MGQPLSGNTGSLSILAGAQNGVSQEDSRILRGLRAGIDEAYEELIERFQQPVYGIVFRLLGNPSDASDVVQDVFLKVFRSVGAFREQRDRKSTRLNSSHARRSSDLATGLRHCLSVAWQSERRQRRSAGCLSESVSQRWGVPRTERSEEHTSELQSCTTLFRSSNRSTALSFGCLAIRATPAT